MSPTAPEVMKESRKTIQTLAQPNNFAAFVAVVGLAASALLVFAQWRYTEKQVDAMQKLVERLDKNNTSIDSLSRQVRDHEEKSDMRFRVWLGIHDAKAAVYDGK